MNNMKIDVVIPMVFHSDKFWQTQLKRYTLQQPDSTRFRDWGLGEVLVDLIGYHMPWINNIIILLSGDTQYQSWMITKHNVRVIYHKDFIPKEYLPTFNAWTIEMFLHEIPDLSEHFIYFNDDMFPIRHLEPSQFFAEKNNEIYPVLRPSFRNPNPETRSVFDMVCQNGTKLAAEEDRTFYGWPYLWYGHGPTPMVRSTIKHFFEKYKERICKTLSNVRDEKNYPQYLWSNFQVITGQFVNRKGYTLDYIENIPSIAALKWFLDMERDCPGDVLCFNDNVRHCFNSVYRKTIKSFLMNATFNEYMYL